MQSEVAEKLNSLVSVGEFISNDEDRLEQERITHEEITRRTFPGPIYTDWLERFQKKLRPRTYVEIGVESGYSLQFAKKPTLAIGIDPNPKIIHGTNTWVKIFKLDSDKFFENYNLTREFDGTPVDLAFIDGLHHYDQALRDFFNVESYSTKSSFIILHDIHPAIPETATRIRNTKYWAGDTWKLMHILAKHRPDLSIHTIPTYPTSLGVITNLNPNSSLSRTGFYDMIEEVKDLEFDFNKPINLVKNDFAIVDRLLKI